MFAERVFAFLLAEHKINDEIAGNMRSWRHSGFSVDNSVRIAKGDKAGMQRLIQYIARCPFSLTRMLSKDSCFVDARIVIRNALLQYRDSSLARYVVFPPRRCR